MLVRCRQCGVALTPTLRRLPYPGPLTLADGADALPRGFFWIAPDEADFWTQVERAALVINVDDAVGLVPVGDRSGCCGPSGGGGPNLACSAGHRIATEVADCWTPRMVLFGPSAVLAAAGEGQVPEARVLLVGAAEPIRSDAEFAAWAHAALGASDWYGNDLAALVREWLGLTEQSACIVWLQAAESERAGVALNAIADAIEQAQQGGRRRLTLCPDQSGRTLSARAGRPH